MKNMELHDFLYLLLIGSCILVLTEAKDKSVSGLENSPMTEAWAVVGGHVLLPCNMDPPVANDSTHLVLFYYGDAGTPIYSLDSRGSRLESATHWADSSVVSRAFVRTAKGQRGLLLEKVTVRDQGHYRCRVDFLESPTRNSRIKLTVVIPPKRVQIFSNIDPRRDLKGMVGPYMLGTEVIYTCQVTGGSPRPMVSWLEGDVLLDNISEVKSGHVTSNEMYQPPLTRLDFNKTLTCVVSNTDLLPAIASSITIDMTYPPTSVTLEDGAVEVILKEGVARRISCEVKGSRPPARVVWRMGDRRLSDISGEVKEAILRRGGTRSVFTYVPGVKDNGVELECSAYNPSLSRIVLKNATKLTVLYKPRMELRPYAALRMTDLREGSDVTLRCLVAANPAVTGVQWAHNGVPIQAMSGHQVKVTQGTLTLRSISRLSSGNYTCAAANTEGATTSNVLHLEVKFPPVCTPGQQTLFGAARHEQLYVPCQVSAYPSPTSFKWAINTTTGIVDIASGLSTRTGSVSTLRYTPQTNLDFGELLCWGTNDVASQREPCVFKVIPAAKPEAVTDCLAERNSSMPATNVMVSCTEGWGGGLNQSFTLEVRQQATESVLEKFSLSAEPIFVINGLKLGVPYLLTVTAANSRGSSPPVTLSYTSPEASADKVISSQTEEETSLSYTPVLLVLVGVLLGITSCVGMVVLIRRKGWVRKTTNLKKGYSASSLKDLDDNLDLPTVVCLDKDEILRDSPTNGSPPHLYATPGKLLNNQSTKSLDNEVLFMKDTLMVPRGKAPLARADSVDAFSVASSMRLSNASSIKLPRPRSRPSSFRSNTSFPLNPDYLLKGENQQKDYNYMAQSAYLADENYFPPGGYLLAHQYLAKSDNLLKEGYLRNEISESFGIPPGPPLETATLNRHHKSPHI